MSQGLLTVHFNLLSLHIYKLFNINSMKQTIITIALFALASLTACSNGESSTDNSGSGPLSPLAEKYIGIAANDAEQREALKDLKGSSDMKEAEKICNEFQAKNDALQEEAKTLAEQMKGSKIPCNASEATGLQNVECTISGVNAKSSSANVVLNFKGASPFDGDYGCLFENEKGEVLAKLRTVSNGDGTLGVIYTLGTKNDGESSHIGSEITRVQIVSLPEFEAAKTISKL